MITAGLKRGMFHLETSSFSGTESGENRWTIGYGAINSFSGRFTVTPNSAWSGQVSAGRLTKPEALEPGNQSRLSASVTHTRPLPQGTWATSLIWGRVHKTTNMANLNSFGLESVARFAGKNYLSGRVELVDKDELPLPGTFRIGAYTAGYTRDFPFCRT